MNTTQTATAARTDLVIGKCGRGHATTGTWADVKAGWISCPCGSRAVAKGMKVTIKEGARCGLRCTSSLGPSCSCSCGGEGHGSDHRF